MPIEFLYWEPSISGPAGHTALRVGDQFYSFWPIMVRPDDTHGASPGIINMNEDLEKFTVGLSKFVQPILQDQKRSLPAGMQPFQIIYEHFDEIRHSSVEMLPGFFTDVDAKAEMLGDLRPSIIDACVVLSTWVKESEFTKETIIGNGNPSVILDISFLNEQALKNRLLALRELGPDLLWYAKVGAITDTSLNNGIKMKFPMCFFKNMSGLRYYAMGKVRHNCASIILDILTAGGIEDYLKDFSEKPYISAALQQTIRFNAQLKNEEPNPALLSSAASIENLYAPLGLMGYGSKPISDWFGTTPAVLLQIVTIAIKQHDNPANKQFCVIL